MKILPGIRIDSDAKALVDMMKGAQVGDVFTWQDMSTCIGRDIRSCAHIRIKAARVLRDEHRMVFATLRGQGLQRMSDIEVVDSTDNDREKIRRHSRRAVKRLAVANYDSLPREKQTKHNAALAVMGVVAEMASNKSAARIARRIEETGAQLPTAKAAIAALGDIS